ncbi:hypothetical protein M514_13281 [Trichuris suis]|uniref:BTB domain-containing protein n=1 Tax=Trichuris suis TaxID=68888 RepID=A0A085NQM9_9BILA|nr:hypothetical protein M513_13281 [Trichuris suis]KFD71775.1 hypothetical protein M514_13281 [Trichuris suis]
MGHHSHKRRSSQLRKLLLHHRSITSAEKALAFAQSAERKEVIEMMGLYVEKYERISGEDDQVKEVEAILGEAVSVLSNCVWLNRHTIQRLFSYKRRILGIIERAFRRPSVPKILAFRFVRLLVLLCQEDQFSSILFEFRDIIACALRWVGSDDLRSDELSFFLRLLRCAAHCGSRACRNLLQLNSANVLADSYARQDCECRLKTVEVLLLVSAAVPDEHWADQILTTEFLPKLMADVKGDCPNCNNCSRFPSLKRAAQRLLLALLRLDGEVKIQLCKHGAIEYVLQCCKKSEARKDEFIRALASFASEAYSRQMMRRTSALLYLAEIFERSDKLQLNELLLRAFVCFRYDESGLLVLLSRESFRAKLFHCLTLFLNSNIGVNPFNDNSSVNRSLSPWKISWCSSPNSRSEFSAQQTTMESSDEGSSLSTDSQVAAVQEVETESVLARSEKELVHVVRCHDMNDCCLCQRLPDYTGFSSVLSNDEFNSVSLCLTLLSSLANQDSLSHTLCSTNVWHTFLALAVTMHYPYEKLICILKQVLRNRNCVELLIENGVCSLIFKYLINPVHQCDNCFALTTAGYDLIATLNHEDETTRYVTKTAVRMFNYGTDQQRLLAACSLPFLSMHLSELHFTGGIAFLCDRLVLSADDDVEQLQDVFTSLSILYHRVCRTGDNTDCEEEQQRDCCYPQNIEAKNQVHFCHPDSDSAIVADRSVLCSNSEFYTAMLEGGFLEAGQSRFPLVTDEFTLRCNELLLHFLHGCYSCSSVRLKSSEECIELIHLASSRLCFDVVTHLVDKEVGRWLSVSNVVEFLRIALPHRITALTEKCLELLFKVHFLDFALIVDTVKSVAVFGCADELCLAAKELFSNKLLSYNFRNAASNWPHGW